MRGAGEQPGAPGRLLLAVRAVAPSLAKVLQAPPAWPVPPILYAGGHGAVSVLPLEPAPLQRAEAGARQHLFVPCSERRPT